MALDLRQNLKLTHQLLMTPQLQQAIKLLQLSRLELEQFVNQQLAENPILEESFDSSQEEEIYEDREKEISTDEIVAGDLAEVSQIVEKQNEEGSSPEVDWENLSRLKELAQQTQPTTSNRSEEDFPNYENTHSSTETLSDYLMVQLGELQLKAQELEIAAIIIGCINDKGYLEVPFEELLEKEKWDFELAEGVLDTIQRFDPPGIAARDLKECLLIQLRELKLKNGVVEKIVADHMKSLETRNFSAISKSLKISLTEVIENVATIATLEPVPARQFGGGEAQTIIPDAYVFKSNGKWMVSLNEDGLPPLKMNEYYKGLSETPEKQDREYVQEKIKSAQWLIKSIIQRQRTIFKVTECIVEKQVEFFEHGVRYLKPMILKDVAEEIGMHESTISRVTSNKFVHTPRGILELKYFFNSSVSRAQGADIASESVKVLIKELLETENPKKPFSDQKIVQLLETKGIQIARRTVAKYREQLGILPSSKRKKYF